RAASPSIWVASAMSGLSWPGSRRSGLSLARSTVRVTSGATAASARSAYPSLSIASPAVKPPATKRTVLPAWRARRSRAQASRASSVFSARTASRGGVGKMEKGSIDACRTGAWQARPEKRTNPEFTGLRRFHPESAAARRPRSGPRSGPRARAGRTRGAPGGPSAGVFDRDLLDAGQQPAALLGLEQVPDFLEAESLGARRLAQHAGEPDAGQVAVGDGLDAQQFGVEQHHFGLVRRGAALGQLLLELGDQVVGQELA